MHNGDGDCDGDFFDIRGNDLYGDQYNKMVNRSVDLNMLKMPLRHCKLIFVSCI